MVDPVAVLLGILVLYVVIKYHEEVLQGALFLLLYAFFVALVVGILWSFSKILELLAPFLRRLLVFLVDRAIPRARSDLLALGFAVFAVGASSSINSKGHRRRDRAVA